VIAASQTEIAEELLREVLEGMCRFPEHLRMEWSEDDATIQIRITAHPTDSRIIVGSNGSHIKQLASLARLLVWGSGKLAQILPVVSLNMENAPFLKYQPLDDWPESYLMDFVRRITEAAFRDSDVTVQSAPETTWAQKFTVKVAGMSNPVAIKRLSQALSVLFQPIGVNSGRMIYVSVK
jgi:predicted RNA-binding protein YlqC (UPF0109 family)